MNLILYSIGIIICISTIIWIIGLLLPKQRIKTNKSIYNGSPKEVFDIVTDNHNWQYRSDLKELKITEKIYDNESWFEISKDNNIIHFKTREKIPYSYYSFEMESKIMTGYWEANFQETDDNKTLFIATEYIEMKNPFLKVLSYLFFDIDKYMKRYQDDLRTEIESKIKKHN